MKILFPVSFSWEEHILYEIFAFRNLLGWWKQLDFRKQWFCARYFTKKNRKQVGSQEDSNEFTLQELFYNWGVIWGQIITERFGKII